jgi:hypothetical protein
VLAAEDMLTDEVGVADQAYRIARGAPSAADMTTLRRCSTSQAADGDPGGGGAGAPMPAPTSGPSSRPAAFR